MIHVLILQTVLNYVPGRYGRAFQQPLHATSIPALEHYGVHAEGDSDEQHDVAVDGGIMAKVRDRQHDRNDSGQPVYGL
jgi:hypothetical protein